MFKLRSIFYPKYFFILCLVLASAILILTWMNSINKKEPDLFQQLTLPTRFIQNQKSKKYSLNENKNVENYDASVNYQMASNLEDFLITRPANYLYSKIICHINEHTFNDCRREEDNVYIPFDIIQKYFDISGHLETNATTGETVFIWQHSSAKVHRNAKKYDHKSIFMNFQYYNVESRDRVQCISAIHGLPVSIQWNAKGYFYAIQIAQFGLSHYSKYITEPSRVCQFMSLPVSFWDTKHSAKIQRIPNENQFYFEAFESSLLILQLKPTLRLSEMGITLEQKDIFLSVMIKFESSMTRLTIQLEATNGQHYNIHYIYSDVVISSSKFNVYYGIGREKRWVSLTRDLKIDLKKGIQLARKHEDRTTNQKIKISLSRIVQIELHGSGFFKNLSICDGQDHLSLLENSKVWFLENQDDRGGWNISVSRTLAGVSKLKPGWYSAMAQGHAMSLLSRVYQLDNQCNKCLEAVYRATDLFKIPSKNGGILAYFDGKHVWYEEYPTIPSSFVLNGFIYALIGLYDSYNILSNEKGNDVKRLFEEGIDSLKILLPFFDNGSGSNYDLRHFSNPKLYPNIARWDYHATHINQLLLLASIDNIDNSNIFNTTAFRWLNYMKGWRAPHN